MNKDAPIGQLSNNIIINTINISGLEPVLRFLIANISSFYVKHKSRNPSGFSPLKDEVS